MTKSFRSSAFLFNPKCFIRFGRRRVLIVAEVQNFVPKMLRTSESGHWCGSGLYAFIGNRYSRAWAVFRGSG